MIICPIVGKPGGHVFWCPGCECAHTIDDRWTYNGNVQQPTIRASVLMVGDPRCHLVVTDGRIKYLGDSSHALAGKTVDMEPLPWDDDGVFQDEG